MNFYTQNIDKANILIQEVSPYPSAFNSKVQSILNNVWVSGIGAGILSGLALTLISRWLQRREYQLRLKTANNEIIYAIRPFIAEKTAPSPIVLNSLLAATAINSGVNRKDLYTFEILADFLIKEVMDNSFLDSEKKFELCEIIEDFRISMKDLDIVYPMDNERVNYLAPSDILLMIGNTLTSLSAVLFLTESEVIEVDKVDIQNNSNLENEIDVSPFILFFILFCLFIQFFILKPDIFNRRFFLIINNKTKKIKK